MDREARIRDEAAEWFLRQRDPARADWDGFLLWLEADAAHNAAYEAVALADDDIAQLIESAEPGPLASNDNRSEERRPGRWRLVTFGGVAAAVAAGFLAWPMMTVGPASYMIETRPGEQRAIQLDGGTRIELNGGSRITLRRGDARYASLDRGEAMFSVVHDPQHPFEVQAGDMLLRDIGTEFNVRRDAAGTGLEASVARGSVMLDPDGQAIRLDAGRVARLAAADITLGRVEPGEVGTWRRSRLVYREASLDRIAEDLARGLGVPVTVDSALPDTRFSGVIMLDTDRSKTFTRIGSLLDVEAVRVGEGWRLQPRKRAAR